MNIFIRRFLLGVLAAMLVLPFAANAVGQCFEYRMTDFTDTGWQPTPSSVCSSSAAYLNGQEGANTGFTGTYTGSACEISASNKKSGERFSIGVFSIQQRTTTCNKCPAIGTDTGLKNMTLFYSTKLDAGGSPVPSAIVKSTILFGGGPYPGRKICAAGCVVELQDPTTGAGRAWTSNFPNSQGLYRSSVDFPTLSNGMECTPTDAENQAASPTAPSPACSGSVGQINGKTTCVPAAGTTGAAAIPGGPSSAGNPVAGSTANGSETGSQRTPANGEGTNSGGPSSAAVVSASTGTSTIPVTSTSSTPNAGTTTQAQYCTDNPTAPACKNSSFGGACDAGFTCDGDAATCAVAKATNESYCQMEKALKPDDSSTPSLASQAANGTDEQSADKLRQAASNAPVSVSSLDVTGRGWSRSCPSDPSFSLPFAGSRSFSIPFSRACGPLGLLANAAVGLTLLGALLWVLGGSNK